MKFLQEVKDSIYSPKFYSKIPQISFKKAFVYFLLLILVLTTIRLITMADLLLFQTPNYLEKSARGLIDCYPQELVVKITGGQVSLNAQEPYFISTCDPETNQKLVVIDTQTPFSAAKLDEYQVPVWVTKDSVVYKKGDFETRSYSLTQIKNFTLDKNTLSSFFDKVTPWFKFIGPVLMFAGFIGFLFYYAFRLVYLLFLAIIIWLLGKFFKLNLTYGQSYKVGLYAITLGLIVELIINVTQPWLNLQGFLFMVTLITLGVFIANLVISKKPSD